MSLPNPFSISYLTEAAMSPDDLLSLYSFLPFRHVGDQLARPTNVFLIGRKGVGKTMLLKMFDPDVMTRLLSRPPREKGILDLIPRATVGTYFNLGAAAARVNLFQGQRHSTEWWQRAYGDYLNTVILDQALHALSLVSANAQWRKMAGVAGEVLSSRSFSDVLFRELVTESSQYENLTSIEALRALLQRRAQAWARYVNMDARSEGPPSSFVPFGVPLFALARAARTTDALAGRFRLFVLVDQYEYLYQHRRKIDFRPIFNAAMYHASRGDTGVEFKIGTRQYAYREFRIAHSDVQIEANREIVEVDVDRLTRKFYRPFAIDLLRKRLAAASMGTSAAAKAARPSTLLPGFAPTEEAQRYISADSLDTSKHLRPFSNRWQRLGVPERVAAAAIGRERTRTANPLVSTLACISLTRWLRDGRTGTPLGVGTPVQGDSVQAVPDYLDRLIVAIGQRYSVGPKRARTDRDLRSIDDFVHDAEDAALFMIASAYKNQRKYYSGLDTIVMLSSNVALVLIEILREAYESLLLEGADPTTKPIPPERQSAAVYSVSESLFSQIPHECDYGETQHRWLSQLGGSLRELQLELTVPQPSPNGFSLSAALSPPLNVEAAGHRTSAATLVTEAISWGLLEERDHESKKRGAPKRRKYYLNRVFCPYFGLSEIRKKDPIYIPDVDAFMEALLNGRIPDAITVTFQRAHGSEVSNEAGPLFNGTT